MRNQKATQLHPEGPGTVRARANATASLCAMFTNAHPDVDQAFLLDCLGAAWDAGVSVERERCASILKVSRAEVSLAAGELSAQEWRTCGAVLQWMRARIRGA